MKAQKKIARIASFVAYALGIASLVLSYFSLKSLKTIDPDTSSIGYILEMFKFALDSLTSANPLIVPTCFILFLSLIYFGILLSQNIVHFKGKELINETISTLIVGILSSVAILFYYYTLEAGIDADCGPFHFIIKWLAYSSFIVSSLTFFASALYLMDVKNLSAEISVKIAELDEAKTRYAADALADKVSKKQRKADLKQLLADKRRYGVLVDNLNLSEKDVIRFKKREAKLLAKQIKKEEKAQAKLLKKQKIERKLVQAEGAKEVMAKHGEKQVVATSNLNKPKKKVNIKKEMECLAKQIRKAKQEPEVKYSWKELKLLAIIRAKRETRAVARQNKLMNKKLKEQQKANDKDNVAVSSRADNAKNNKVTVVVIKNIADDKLKLSSRLIRKSKKLIIDGPIKIVTEEVAAKESKAIGGAVLAASTGATSLNQLNLSPRQIRKAKKLAKRQAKLMAKNGGVVLKADNKDKVVTDAIVSVPVAASTKASNKPEENKLTAKQIAKAKKAHAKEAKRQAKLKAKAEKKAKKEAAKKAKLEAKKNKSVAKKEAPVVVASTSAKASNKSEEINLTPRQILKAKREQDNEVIKQAALKANTEKPVAKKEVVAVSAASDTKLIKAIAKDNTKKEIKILADRKKIEQINAAKELSSELEIKKLTKEEKRQIKNKNKEQKKAMKAQAKAEKKAKKEATKKAKLEAKKNKPVAKKEAPVVVASASAKASSKSKENKPTAKQIAKDKKVKEKEAKKQAKLKAKEAKRQAKLKAKQEAKAQKAKAKADKKAKKEATKKAKLDAKARSNKQNKKAKPTNVSKAEQNKVDKQKVKEAKKQAKLKAKAEKKAKKEEAKKAKTEAKRKKLEHKQSVNKDEARKAKAKVKAEKKAKKVEARKAKAQNRKDIKAKKAAERKAKVNANKIKKVNDENRQKAKAEKKAKKVEERKVKSQARKEKKAKKVEERKVKSQARKAKRMNRVNAIKARISRPRKKVKPVKKLTTVVAKAPAIIPLDEVVTVYHVLPHNNGETWWIKRMGEERPSYVFNTRAEAYKYAKENVVTKPGVRVFYHDIEGKIVGDEI